MIKNSLQFGRSGREIVAMKNIIPAFGFAIRIASMLLFAGVSSPPTPLPNFLDDRTIRLHIEIPTELPGAGRTLRFDMG